MNLINELKKSYLKKEPTLRLKKSGWVEISKKIDDETSDYRRNWSQRLFFNLSLMGAFFLALILASSEIQSSLPGTPLYPIKILSEKVIETTTGNNHVRIENRAKEIIELVKKSKNEDYEEHIKEVVKHYEEEVKEAQSKPDNSVDEKPELENKLKEEHIKFEEVLQEVPSASDEVKPAIVVSAPSKPEVKDLDFEFNSKEELEKIIHEVFATQKPSPSPEPLPTEGQFKEIENEEGKTSVNLKNEFSQTKI